MPANLSLLARSPLDSIEERKLDLLLLVAIHGSSAFRNALVEKLTGETPAQFISAWRGVFNQHGEIDVLLLVRTHDNHRLAIMIEHKIDAGFQDRQADRYRTRGRLGVAEGHWDRYLTCLCAPKAYAAPDIISTDWDRIVFLEGEMKQDEEGIGGGAADGAPKPAIDKLHVGAAASALVSAAIGDIAVVYSRSPEHKHYSLADIEWLILPAVLRGQFYVAQAARKDSGLRAPIAVATWAFVSEEVDRRLSADLTHRIRLRPDEWKGGEIAWIVDLVGAPAGLGNAVQWLKAGPFKEREAKVVVRDAKGAARQETIGRMKVGQANELAKPAPRESAV